MRFSMDIDYPLERMQATRRRLEARGRFGGVDRVPVQYCLVPRFFLPRFGIPYAELFRDAETQYALELRIAKERLELIPEDFCVAPEVTVFPYFDNVASASAFGADVRFLENETPQAVPVLTRPEEARRIQPATLESGLWKTTREWWAAMRELAADTRLTFCGRHEGRVVVGPLSVAGYGAHMIGVDLAGEHFYRWMAEQPDVCHEMLALITRATIEAERECRRIDPRPRGTFGVAEDSIQICSPSMYREFCVPYDELQYLAFGSGLADGRGMHMCGDSRHLLDALLHDGRITSFNLFGSKVPPKLAAEKLGGRVRLWGNLDPVLLLEGTPADVKQAAVRALEAMAPSGGLLLGDGANVCPGTPLDSFVAVMQAAKEYGEPVPAAG